ncbi:MAG TPA: chemotaxis protein CheW [Firmicutes bacterium]|jgi:purine-binding chemotaxis protein CheW|uniref:chemotaxis protein CheW n=1 Tax=Gelria sp. Kuro-4 TaxID=2796927 RepID=UPI00199EE807|nr:chemotaxis protein CheW [Gelria sp. Kuro-4]MDI3521896.1 purine-binding chemotaxis protein CheW [Bacillota bacterium]MDK2926566.1 purine-binding chemotaxis protein CheW [Bacillota bacterium]BCV24947.1 chemotaxis protein CheW [Gelria sp. Kuro-4]HHV56189.1 chemotaxis protein CheW [Bacillota bacterium]
MQSKERQLVVFTLGQEEYGVDILEVQEIKRLTEITRVPNAPAFVEGVINLRGNVIPVIDLHKRFGLGAFKPTEESRIVIVTVRDLTLGIMVDSVSEVLTLEEAAIAPPPPLVAGIEATFLQGIGKLDNRLLILLNMDRILGLEEVAAAREVKEQATEAGAGQ